MTEIPRPPEPPPYPGDAGPAETPPPMPPPPPLAPPSIPPPAGNYPITLTFDTPEKIARWRPLVHWLLAIPHFIVLYVIDVIAFVLVVLAWFSGVFTGRISEGLQKPLAMTQRYNASVTTYMFWLREEYPPFTFDGSFSDPGQDPRLRVDVVPAIEGRSRLTIFFRIFMIIPQIFVLFFVSFAVCFVVFIGFFAVIILGRWPTGLGNFVVGFTRWTTRLNGYFYLLTDEYPPFRTK
ncbi:MAG: DUF4389 domain-containing protein [Aeromicrobium sp.]